MKPTELERNTGLRVYGTQTPGIRGCVRTIPEDFIVEEVLTSGEIASIESTGPDTVRGAGDFLLCILIKSGYDTFTALKRMSNTLHVNSKRISVGGLKDARAFTAQYVTIRHVDPNRLKNTNRNDMRVVPIRFTDVPISAESLLGNRFRIKIRGVQIPLEELNGLIGQFIAETNRLRGVPNFYGHQRFGTLRPITHIVGRHIVKREFEQAVLTYLTEPSFRENLDSLDAKKSFLEERNPKKALVTYPSNLTYERSMLRYLANNEGDYLGALRKLPLRLRRLLVNAYESFLFNEFLSERVVHKLPLNGISEGDYVLDVGSDGLPTGNARIVNGKDVEDANEALSRGRLVLALPAPGYAIKLSGGRQGEIEQEVLEREDVTTRGFYVGPMHEASSSGKYRPALVGMREFEARVERDEIIRERSTLALQFFLPRGSYATIVLRELMKPIDVIKAGF